MPDYHHVTVVPARLASTRLAAKNIRMVGGRPAICWVLEAVAELGSEIWVSVEPDGQGDQVQGLVDRYVGDRVKQRLYFHRRDAALCAPSVDVQAVVDDVLDTMERTHMKPVTQVSIALATSVLLRATDLFTMVSKSLLDGHGYMMVTRMYLDPNDTLALSDDGALVRATNTLEWPGNRQRLVIDAGMFYTYPAAVWRAHGFYPPDGLLRPYPMRRTEAVDIDEEEDLRLAKVLFGAQQMEAFNDYGNWRPR